MTRRIDALLEEYGESHQNPTNKLVHWVCVPVIVWTVLAGIWSLPVPAGWGGFNWLWLTLALAFGYYLILSPALALGVGLYAAVCVAVILALASSGLTVWKVAAVLFVLAWIGQFWGHKIEGKKPSFFKDVQFLLIGPAWLISFLYRRAGIGF